jgi:hypothetical protein
METEEKKFYDDVRFVKAENLKGRAKEAAIAAGITEGLALLRTSINSAPQYEIEKIDGDPLEAIQRLGEREGITKERLNRALESAFSEC